MCLSAVLGVGSALIGGSAAKKAAGTQANAARDAAQVQQNMFDTTSQYFQPYRQAGENALNTYVNQVGTDFTQSPGYEFGLQGGVDAIDASAASRGNLNSGATMQALNQFGQDYATRNYDNWLNRVGGIMSTGQASAGQQAALGQNFANNQANLLQQGAQATAQGQLGAAQAIQGAIPGVADAIYNYQAAQPAAPMTSPRPVPRPY